MTTSPLRKEAFFDDHWGDGWPNPTDIEYRLTDQKGREQFFAKGRDGGSFFADGLYGTGHLSPQAGLVKSALYMHMNPEHGVKLQYSRWDGRIGQRKTFHSKGNFSHLREFVRSFHGTPLSVGLFVPFAAGCKAVNEFIVTGGEQPQSIEWIFDDDLPSEIFQSP